MKKLSFLPVLLAAVFLLQGCGAPQLPGNSDNALSDESVSASVPESSEAQPDTEAPDESAGIVLPDIEPAFSPAGYSREYTAQCFCSLVLGSAEDTSLHRWEHRIVCFADGKYSESDKDILESFPDVLSPVDGFPGFSISDKESEANLIVHFCDRDELIDFAGKEAGYTELDSALSVHTGSGGAIESAEIYIRTDVFEYDRERLIIKELLRSLGLLYEADIQNGSVFSSGSMALNSPSEFDYLMLRLLYNSNIKCGMGRDSCSAYAQALVN